MEQVLGFVNRRQDLISSNIANANTPGYTAFDIVLKGSMDSAASLQPRTSSPRHMTLESSGSAPTGARLERSSEPARLDGNNVNLDDELRKLLENRIMYQVAMELKDRWGKLKPVARGVR